MHRNRLLIFTQLMLLTAGLIPSAVLAVPDGPPFGVYLNEDFSPTVTVLESNTSQIRLSLVMEHLPTGQTIDLANVPDGLWGEMNPSGSLIPRFSLLLALPPTGNPTVTTEIWNTTTLSAISRQLPENDPSPQSVSLGQVGIFGGVRVVPVVFRPIAYTNGATTCAVMSNAVIRLDIDDDLGQNPVAFPPTGFSTTWQKVLRATVTNWDFIPNYFNTLGSHILMIVPDANGFNFIPAVQDFVKWKEQRGIKVTVVPKSSIGVVPSAFQIKARIQSEVNAADPPIDFVILVGDETVLTPYFQLTNDPPTRFSTASVSGNFTSENYFAELKGTDVFPDVFVGRWVVNTSAEVTKIVGRTLLHERDPFVADSLRFERAVVAADNTVASQKETKQHVRRELLSHGYSDVDTVFMQDGAVRMINRVDLGQTFINYRGSGWDFGWAGIHFYYNDIASLNNIKKLPIVTGIGCGVGIFAGEENRAFGEQWMLAGTVTSPKGSVGFIGPCWNTHTVYNDCLDSLLYRAWLNYEVRQLAPGLASGKMMVWTLLSQFLGESAVLEVTNTMFRQYLVQGDPSLQVYTDTPIRPQVSVPSQVPSGQSDLAISVNNISSLPADSVNVTVWVGDGDFVTRWLNHSSGTSVTLPVNTNGADSIAVTITGENVVAYQTWIPVVLSVAPQPQAGIPAELELGQNYPNPFNSTTSIEFGIPVSGNVKLEVFDILGKHVTTLVNSHLSSGRYHAAWQGTNDRGQSVVSGVYFYRLTTPQGAKVQKMAFIR
ncbi:MAG: C25 family cysteine peptidase [Calditrichota bacterium]